MAMKATPAVTTTTTVAATPIAPAPIRSRKENYFPWRRFWISVIGIGILMSQWKLATWNLYTLPKESFAVFGSITNATQYAITFIVAWFITGQVVFGNWSLASTSSIVSDVKGYFESKKSKEKK